MRKFNLFDKVEFMEKRTGNKILGCIVGFTTDEKDGCIIDIERGVRLEPEEHAYIVLIGDINQDNSYFEEFLETELCTPCSTSTFKDRLELEQAELEEKLTKLNDFNQSEKANEIDPVQKSLLIIQAGAMYTYNECLIERLARL